MNRQPPRSKRTATYLHYTTLFRPEVAVEIERRHVDILVVREPGAATQLRGDRGVGHGHFAPAISASSRRDRSCGDDRVCRDRPAPIRRRAGWACREISGVPARCRRPCGRDGRSCRRACRRGSCRYRPAPPAQWSTRSEEHTSELQSLMRISYAVFCLKKKKYTDAYS